MRNIIAGLAALTLSSAALAQDWPTRPVTMVVPFAAGGPVDTLGRLLTPRLSEVLGQNVIIENIGAAGGATGTIKVRDAAPDGYTFVLGSIGTHTLNQLMTSKPAYDAANDFAPVMLIVDVPIVLITKKDLPVKDLKEFIAYAKANQGKMVYGSGGVGTSGHIACVLLNMAIGVDVTHIPYRGGGPAFIDFAAGRLDYMCNLLQTAVQPIESKQANPIAMLTRERSEVLPDLPTAHEQGLTDFSAYTWHAIFLPKGTPRPILDKLNAAMREVLATPAVRKRLQETGMVAVAPERQTPEYLAQFVRDEIKKWTPPIKAAGLDK